MIRSRSYLINSLYNNNLLWGNIFNISSNFWTESVLLRKPLYLKFLLFRYCNFLRVVVQIWYFVILSAIKNARLLLYIKWNSITIPTCYVTINKLFKANIHLFFFLKCLFIPFFLHLIGSNIFIYLPRINLTGIINKSYQLIQLLVKATSTNIKFKFLKFIVWNPQFLQLYISENTCVGLNNPLPFNNLFIYKYKLGLSDTVFLRKNNSLWMLSWVENLRLLAIRHTLNFFSNVHRLMQLLLLFYTI